MTVLQNYTGAKDCAKPPEVADPALYKLGQDANNGWRALMCTSIAMPLVNGFGSMFPSGPQKDYEYEERSKWCEQTYGLKPNFDFVLSEFGGYNVEEDFQGYSNMVFVNGDMDPWLPGCVQTQVKDDLPVLTVKNGAHHADSYLPRPDDSNSTETNVNEVRSQIMGYLEKWFSQHAKELKESKSKASMVQVQNQLSAYPKTKKKFSRAHDAKKIDNADLTWLVARQMEQHRKLIEGSAHTT